MATLTFPSIVPDFQTFGMQYNTQVSTSSLNGITQTVELPGARWKGSMTFTEMTPIQAADLKAFLLELRGSSGRFLLGDFSHTSPFNAVTSVGTIESTSISSLIRVTLGAASPAFSAGDYIQIGTGDTRELKMIVDSTNIAGDVYDLTLESNIRRTDFIGLTITYTNPKGLFMLTSDDQALWGVRSKALLSDINMDFVEVFA